jgi:hypothetical protein
MVGVSIALLFSFTCKYRLVWLCYCGKRSRAILLILDKAHLRCAQTQVVANGTTSDNGKTQQYDYDFFSIGGGTGGVRAARWSAMNFGGSQCQCSTPSPAQYPLVHAKQAGAVVTSCCDVMFCVTQCLCVTTQS